MTKFFYKVTLILGMCMSFSWEAHALSYLCRVSPENWKIVDRDEVIYLADDKNPSTDDRLVEFSVQDPCKVWNSQWSAELNDDSVLAMTNDESQGKMFRNGVLVARLVNGREQRKINNRVDEGDFQRLWLDEKARNMCRSIPDIWSGSRRLRLWYANPNVAAVLFVELALLFLLLLHVNKLWVRILGVIAFLVCLVGIFATESRGGLVAVVSALFVMVLPFGKRLFRPRIVLLGVFIMLGLVAGIVGLGKTERYTKNFFKQDERNSRVDIWMSVPSMVAAAPVSGWGIGNSGDAYVKWFQKECTCLVKDMVGTHFTNLVEFDLSLRFIYVFVWFLALMAALHTAFRRKQSVPLGILVAMCAASVFNPTFNCAELWILPIGCAVYVVYREKDSFRRLVCMSSLVSFAMIVAILTAGHVMSADSYAIKCTRAGVQIGSGEPEVCILDDGFTMNGGFWWQNGRELRTHFGKNAQEKCTLIINSVDSLPNKIKKLVVVGEQATKFLEKYRTLEEVSAFGQVVFLSPNLTARQVPDFLAESGRFTMYQGQLAAILSGARVDASSWYRSVKGCELYLTDWLEIVYNESIQNEG